MEVDEVIKTIAKDKVLGVPARLAIMIYLLIREEAFFNDLLQALELTPGNLWSHVKRLEEAGYVRLRRVVSTRPHVKIVVTPEGVRRTLEFISLLKKVTKEAVEA